MFYVTKVLDLFKEYTPGTRGWSRLCESGLKKDAVKEDTVKEDMVKTVLKEEALKKESKWGNRLRPPDRVGQDEKGSMVIKIVLKEEAIKKKSKWGNRLRPPDTGVTVVQDEIHKEDVVNKAGHEIKKLSDISAS